MKKFLKITGVLLFSLVLVVLVRWMLAPPAPKFLDVTISADESTKLSTKISRHLIDIKMLSDQLSSSRIWLVGEEHFYNETISFFLKLLETVPDRKIVLLIELPREKQEVIEAYMATGDEKQFDLIWGDDGDSCLPYFNILRWAFKNKDRILGVRAMDENQWHITLMRALLTDTRNETMAQAIETTQKPWWSPMVAPCTC
jgi:hypothetical protein